MSNRICAWCKVVMGYKAGLKPGDLTHGMCNHCFEDMFPAPQIDEVMLNDLMAYGCGMVRHELAQLTHSYVATAEYYHRVDDFEEKTKQRALWLKCHRRLSVLRKQQRRKRLRSSKEASWKA